MSLTTNRDILLDLNGDLDTSKPDLQQTNGLQAVQQAVQIALLFFRGEWFLNLDAGVPYWEQVLVKNPNANVLNSIFRNQILGVLGVKSILALVLTYDPTTRALSVSYTANTDFGQFDAVVTLAG